MDIDWLIDLIKVELWFITIQEENIFEAVSESMNSV